MNPIVKRYFEKQGLSNDAVHYFAGMTDDSQSEYLPQLLMNAELFVSLLHDYQNSEIAIVPDYDADGIFSGTLLAVALDLFGFNTPYIYPPKTREGFGMSIEAVETIRRERPDVRVIITTDNGSSAFDSVALAKSYGYTVLVTDHHLAGKVPDADCVVNPNQPHDTYPFKGISGTTVIYKLMLLYAQTYHSNDIVGLVRRLQVFVGMSVVSDVMPMLEENRYFTRTAVYALSHADVLLASADMGQAVGSRLYSNAMMSLYELVQLLDVAGKMKYGVDEDTIGFYISPMMNALRRMLGESALGFQFFLTDDVLLRQALASHIFDLNEERKSLVKQYTGALSDVFDGHAYNGIVTCVNTIGGLAGLLAGRLSDEFDTPTFVFTYQVDNDGLFVNPLTIDGVIHASGRAPNWFDLHSSVNRIRAAHPEWFVSFGGHRSAAGLGLYAKYFMSFQQAFAEAVSSARQNVSETAETDSLIVGKDFMYDEQLVKDAVYCFDTMKPYGNMFKKPSFVIPVQVDADMIYMGADKQHVKFVQNGLTFIMWNGRDKLTTGLHIFVGKFSINTFRHQETLQFIIDNIC